MRKVILCATLLGLTTIVMADELTMRVETELAALGYDVGPIDGEETMETVIAVSKFQAESNLAVTGEVSPQLADAISARAANPGQAGAGASVTAAGTSAAAAPADTAAELQAAQQACLEHKMAKAQEKSKVKRGLGRLVSAVTRNASPETNQEISAKASDVYNANATADDLSAAAKDLGLSKKDVEKCQNPG